MGGFPLELDRLRPHPHPIDNGRHYHWSEMLLNTDTVQNTKPSIKISKSIQTDGNGSLVQVSEGFFQKTTVLSAG